MSQDPSQSRKAFTLVELLVVMAVIALLTGILLPSLASARNAAKTTRELSAGQQLMVAYTLYADDSKSTLLPGYPPDSWVETDQPPGTPSLNVVDDLGRPVTGTQARRYPWRIVPYMDFNFFGLYKEERILRDYRSRSPDQYQYLVSLSPSFGLNSTFVGGDSGDARLGFDKNVQSRFGSFYITRLDQPQRPGSLIVFASAEGPGLDGLTTPGFFRIDAPYIRTRRWSVPPRWNVPGAAPEEYGQVAYRHQGKAAVMHFDAHAVLATYGQLDDMTRWADAATGPAWAVGQK